MSLLLVQKSLDALRQELAGGAQVASCAAPPNRALGICASRLGEHAAYWSDPESESKAPRAAAPAATSARTTSPSNRSPKKAWVGVGAAQIVASSGSERLSAAQARMTAFFSRLALPESTRGDVRFVGGAAFTTGRDGSGCWADFGEGTFVLPRVIYVDDALGARLLVVAPDSADVAPGLELAAQILAHLATDEDTEEEASGSLPTRTPDPIDVLEHRTSANAEEFGELVLSIRASIRAGVVSKVVAARRVTLTLSRAPEVARVLARLRSDAPSCTRFSFRIGARTFVSATPELLVETDGVRLWTEALAGTIALGPEGLDRATEARLLSSRKDREEHAFVVEAIESALLPVTRGIERAALPAVRRLARLAHLCTPIEAELRAPLPILDLVERLHPTPAVGGLPRLVALGIIERSERAERGWYAAPFGWVDAQGRGKFVVALRSALLHENKVHLFAGAGIVADSDPALEFAETELKLGAIQRALGLTTAARSTQSA